MVATMFVGVIKKSPQKMTSKLLNPASLMGIPETKAIFGGYGHRGGNALVGHLLKKGLLPDNAVPVDMFLDIENENYKRMQIDEVQSYQSLHLNRAAKDLKEFIVNRWQKIGGESDLFKFGTDRPDLIDRLVSCALLKHLDIVTYNLNLNGEIIPVVHYYGPKKAIKFSLER